MNELSALEGVRGLHARYGDAVWRQDMAAYGDCWTENAEWRIMGKVNRGRGEIVDFFAGAMTRFRRVLMTFRTPMITLGDGEVLSRSYVTENNGLYDGTAMNTVGIYYERLVEQEGVWRRDWALFQLAYRGPADMTGHFVDHADYGPPPAFPGRDEMPTL